MGAENISLNSGKDDKNKISRQKGGYRKIGVLVKFLLTIRHSLTDIGIITVKMCSYQRNNLVVKQCRNSRSSKSGMQSGKQVNKSKIAASFQVMGNEIQRQIQLNYFGKVLMESNFH